MGRSPIDRSVCTSSHLGMFVSDGRVFGCVFLLVVVQRCQGIGDGGEVRPRTRTRTRRGARTRARAPRQPRYVSLFLLMWMIGVRGWTGEGTVCYLDGFEACRDGFGVPCKALTRLSLVPFSVCVAQLSTRTRATARATLICRTTLRPRADTTCRPPTAATACPPSPRSPWPRSPTA